MHVCARRSQFSFFFLFYQCQTQNDTEVNADAPVWRGFPFVLSSWFLIHSVAWMQHCSVNGFNCLSFFSVLPMTRKSVQMHHYCEWGSILGFQCFLSSRFRFLAEGRGSGAWIPLETCNEIEEQKSDDNCSLMRHWFQLSCVRIVWFVS